MKKLVLLIGFSFFFIAKINAQQVIAVQNGNTIFLYDNLDSAIISAKNGDTIYIPGGAFSLNTPISKRIYIYGVGHKPDSSITNNYTIISSDIIILSAASQGSITGIKCIGNLNFGNSQATQNVNNFIISNCYIQGNLSLGFFDTTMAMNNVFIGNIFPATINLYYSKGNAFYNNIFNLVKNIGESNLFRNNIFNMTGQTNYSDGYFWYGVMASFVNAAKSTFENNIFRGRLLSSNGYNIQFRNCAFSNNLFANEGPSCTGCTDINSFVNQPDSSIFVNYPIGQAFSYSLNYQLKLTSLGKNAGTDGTDIGIYGGTFPWDDSGQYGKPVIYHKKVSPTSTNDGKLKVEYKVRAGN